MRTAENCRGISFLCTAMLVGVVLNGVAAAHWTQITARIPWPYSPEEAHLASWQDQLWCGIAYSGLVSSTDGNLWNLPITVPWEDAHGFTMLTHGENLWVIGAEFYGPTNVYVGEDAHAWSLRGDLSEFHGGFETPSLHNHTSLSFKDKLWVLGGAFWVEGGDELDTATGGEEWKGLKKGGPFEWHPVNMVLSSDQGSDWDLVTYAPWANRDSHSSVVFDSKMWVMGGYIQEASAPVPVNDVWRSEDGVTWSEVTPAAPWSPRAGHASVVLDGKIWVLGGNTAQGPVNDIWCSKDGVQWMRVTDQAPWSPRSKHSCVVHQDKLWLAGGFASGWLLDVWVYEPDAEGEGSAAGDGEGAPVEHYHTADQNQDERVDLTEILRVIQFYNLGDFHCAIPPESTEDGYAPGVGDISCARHDSDYAPRDWRIGLSELLRLIQFFNTGGYSYCPESGTEDGFCPAGQ